MSAHAPPPKSPPQNGPGHPPHQTLNAFGVSVELGEKSVAEKQPMGREKKGLIYVGGLLATIVGVLWLQYRPASDLDSEAAANPGVRQVVELQNKKDAAGLAQLARSDDAAVARRAVFALADVGGSDAVRDYANDRRAEVRYAVVTGLGRDADPSALPLLSKYAQDPASDVRVAAIRSISNIRDFTIFDHLYPSLNDPDPSVRRAALGAIEERIGLKFPDYKPEDSSGNRAKAVARMRAQIGQMKQVFDRANQFELSRQQRSQAERR
jgi:HEAT repeat protein